jgi:hypothetical protein
VVGDSVVIGLVFFLSARRVLLKSSAIPKRIAIAANQFAIRLVVRIPR